MEGDTKAQTGKGRETKLMLTLELVLDLDICLELFMIPILALALVREKLEVVDLNLVQSMPKEAKARI